MFSMTDYESWAEVALIAVFTIGVIAVAVIGLEHAVLWLAHHIHLSIT